MPTVLRIGPYQLYLYPHDVLHEPPHVHVGRDRDEAKFWLNPVELERNRGFAGHELRKIEGSFASTNLNSLTPGTMSQTKQRKSHIMRQMLEDELDRARTRRGNVTEDMLTLYLEDGRVLGMPTVWSPRLSEASEAERQNYEIIGHGAGLHWPDLDEYVSVRSILLGRRSAEHMSESEDDDH